MPKQYRGLLKKTELSLLASPFFLGSLLLLLCNDFLLKSYFHNWLTGKLSDFAGIIALSLFWIAFFPHWKRGIVLLTAFAFICWKLPVSSGFITIWNSYFFTISRTIDPGDLIALAVLPVVYYYQPKRKLLQTRPAVTVAISIIALFAFCATSKVSQTYHYKETYHFSAPISVIKIQIDSLFKTYEDKDGNTSIIFDTDTITNRNSNARISYISEDSTSSITLYSISVPYRMPNMNEENAKILFDQKVIKNLRSFTNRESRFYPFKWFDDMDGFALMAIIFLALFLLGLTAVIVFIIRRSNRKHRQTSSGSNNNSNAR